MTFPQNVLTLIEQAAHKYPDDIDAAVKHADKQLRKLAVFASLVDQLVATAIRDRIQNIRHFETRAAKGKDPKVVVGSSLSVQQLGDRMYAIKIAGMSLGNIFGEDLAGIAGSQRAIGEGCLVNAQLASELAKIVPDGKRVRDVVSGPKIRTILRKAQKDIEGKAAA